MVIGFTHYCCIMSEPNDPVDIPLQYIEKPIYICFMASFCFFFSSSASALWMLQVFKSTSFVVLTRKMNFFHSSSQE